MSVFSSSVLDNQARHGGYLEKDGSGWKRLLEAPKPIFNGRWVVGGCYLVLFAIQTTLGLFVFRCSRLRLDVLLLLLLPPCCYHTYL